MKTRNILLTSAALLFSAASISAATTTIAHTWVSGSGSDTNPCTFASPCLTFQGALSNTSAGGLITAKDAGDFGQVSISKSVTIDGSNLGSITISGNNDAIYITTSVNVTLRNLTINGLGSLFYGIYDRDGGTLIVNNCDLENIAFAGVSFSGAGNLTVENSRIESFIGGGATIGIEIAANAAQYVVVKNTVIDASPISAGNYGLVISSGAGFVQASLQNVTIMGAGLEAVYAQTGNTQITGSVITQSNYGVVANGATISVASSMITANTTGVCSTTGSKIRLDNNDIYDNTTAIANCGGTYKTSGTNRTSGAINATAAEVSNSVLF
jgi:hypothetical protein